MLVVRNVGWKDSGLSALIVVERETFEVSTQKTSFRDHLLSQQPGAGTLHCQVTHRGTGTSHLRGSVGSNNLIRDVTFSEDSVKTKVGNQAQVIGLLRCLAIELVRKTSPKNFLAAIGKFADSPDSVE